MPPESTRPSPTTSTLPPAPPLWLLVIITTSGTFGIHVFIPALPQASAALLADTGTMQLTISLYILGLAIGQLIYGPLSDTLGRRPVLLAGLVLYTLGGLLAALAPEVHVLVVTRLLQALGGCAGLALGRAMVRDTAAPREAASRMAILNLAVSVGPAAAPLIGSMLAVYAGWRGIFVFLFLMGGITTLLALWLLPETSQRGRGRSVPALLRDYRQLVTSPAFLGFAIGGGCATTSWYAYLTPLPFMVVQQLGRPVHDVGIIALAMVLGTSIGNFLASRLAARMPLARLLIAASLVGVVGAVLFLLPVMLGWVTLLTIIAGPFLFMLGVGITSPLALTKAVSVNPAVIGSAAGLYGCCQMAVGAVCAALVAIFGNPALGGAVVLCCASLIGLACFGVSLSWERRAARANAP